MWTKINSSGNLHLVHKEGKMARGKATPNIHFYNQYGFTSFSLYNLNKAVSTKVKNFPRIDSSLERTVINLTLIAKTYFYENILQPALKRSAQEHSGQLKLV